MHPEQSLPHHVPLVVIQRSGHIESVHNGSLIVIDPEGNEKLTLGDPSSPMYPRSALKPLQALVMMQLGYTGTPRNLALAAASHSGEEIHVTEVKEMLASAGLTADSLLNTPDLPIGAEANKSAIRDQMKPSALYQNCSGKHAAMLATCVKNGWETKSYLDPQHPLQRAIAQGIEEITGEKILDTAVDGCGAPLFLMPLTALAKGFAHIAKIAQTDPQSNEARLYNAITQNPEHLAGSDRDTSAMMRSVPGLMCKDGAEAVHAGALNDGTVFALKIGDGTQRARTTATLRVLEVLGHDMTAVKDAYEPKVLGHGKKAGSAYCTF